MMHTNNVADFYTTICSHGLICMQYKEMRPCGTWHAKYATRSTIRKSAAEVAYPFHFSLIILDFLFYFNYLFP